MKKALRILALLLALSLLSIPALAAEKEWTFRSDRYGFSFTLPEELAKNIVIEEYSGETVYVFTPGENGWSSDGGRARDGTGENFLPEDADSIFQFRYAPEMTAPGWGGNLGTLRVKTPKSAFFADEYSYASCPIIAETADSAFVRVGVAGGVDAAQKDAEAYFAAFSALDAALGASIKADGGVAVPELDETRIPAQVEKLNSSSTTPDAPLTRGECAQLLYELIRPESGALEPDCPFADIEDTDTARAVAYLADCGIISGYADGTFRPERSVTRAEFVKMLHRSLFIPFPAWYGDPIEFSDVSPSHWAWGYLNCACEGRILIGDNTDRVWLRGYPDGTLRPDAPVTRAEAAIIITRLMDEA